MMNRNTLRISTGTRLVSRRACTHSVVTTKQVTNSAVVLLGERPTHTSGSGHLCSGLVRGICGSKHISNSVSTTSTGTVGHTHSVMDRSLRPKQRGGAGRGDDVVSHSGEPGKRMRSEEKGEGGNSNSTR